MQVSLLSIILTRQFAVIMSNVRLKFNCDGQSAVSTLFLTAHNSLRKCNK